MSDRRGCEETDWSVLRRNSHRMREKSSLTWRATSPICLSSLYFAPERAAEAEVDLEAGVSRTTTTTCTSTTNSISSQEAAKKAELELPPIDDEVMKMKRCQHLFHARCLATWFLRRRYDCPVCRTPYYQEVETRSVRDEIHEQPPMPVLPFW